VERNGENKGKNNEENEYVAVQTLISKRPGYNQSRRHYCYTGGKRTNIAPRRVGGPKKKKMKQKEKKLIIAGGTRSSRYTKATAENTEGKGLGRKALPGG